MGLSFSPMPLNCVGSIARCFCIMFWCVASLRAQFLKIYLGRFPTPQLPNSPSAQACRGVGELGTWPILTFQFPKCADQLPKCADARGVGELAWVSASRMVEGEFWCWQFMERHTAGRGHGGILWQMDGCRIKGAAVLGCCSSQWHLKLFWLFNEAIKCWQVPDQVANRVNVWNNCA